MSQDKSKKCEKRLFALLAAHRREFLEEKSDASDIVAFMAKLGYSLLQLLNDFNALLAREQSNDEYAERFYCRLLASLDGRQCDVSECLSAARHARLKGEALTAADAQLQGKEGMCQQILDTVHVHCLHSFDRFRLLREDAAHCELDAAKVAQLVQHQVEQYTAQLQQPQAPPATHSKFMTVLPVDAPSVFLEDVTDYLLAQHVRRQSVETLQRFAAEHEFDTDALS